MESTVIVVNWRQPDLTRRCLESLFAQAGPATEVVLVENEASPGARAEWESEFSGLVVVAVPGNLGFAGGVARGLDVASGDVIVLVNNDAVAGPGFLEIGTERLLEGPMEVAAVAATVLLEGGFRPAAPDDDPEHVLVGNAGARWVRSERGGTTLINGTGVELTADGNGHDRDWLVPAPPDGPPVHSEPPFGFSGGAAFIRRRALDDVGGFDESLFMYYEDLDLAWRLRLAGHEIVHAEDATTIHVHAGSSSSSGSLVRYQSMRNRLAVVVRNGSPSMVTRVVARTVGKCVTDLLSTPRQRQLEPRDWLRLWSEAPRLVVGALRSRCRDGVGPRDRVRVESLLRR